MKFGFDKIFEARSRQRGYSFSSLLIEDLGAECRSEGAAILTLHQVQRSKILAGVKFDMQQPAAPTHVWRRARLSLLGGGVATKGWGGFKIFCWWREALSGGRGERETSGKF